MRILEHVILTGTDASCADGPCWHGMCRCVVPPSHTAIQSAPVADMGMVVCRKAPVGCEDFWGQVSKHVPGQSPTPRDQR
eukprot:408756-Rhodomonas_salina.2